MDFPQILLIGVALATIATGLISLVKPQAVTGFTGLSPDGPRGISEIRSVLGGLFIGLGAAPLIYGTPEAYRVLGIGYLAVGVARTFSIVYDRSTARSNLISVVVEYVFGVILLLLPR